MSILKYLFNSAADKLKQLADDRPDHIKAGELMETICKDIFFPPQLYQLVRKTHTNETNAERFVEDSLLPDFTFRTKEKFGIEFNVEVKLRNNHNDIQTIPVFQPGQLKRYHQAKNCFLFLVTYYKSDVPSFYLVPMNSIKWDKLFLSFLKPYILPPDKPVQFSLIKSGLKS